MIIDEHKYETYTPFTWLLHAHDHLWNDRHWPLYITKEASHVLWLKVIETHTLPVPLNPEVK
jgi:hypothetical protein